jgi:hypothetical protein
MPEGKERKEILIHWHTAQLERIDLGSSVAQASEPPVNWAGAIQYLMQEDPRALPLHRQFSFPVARRITEHIIECQAQADRKVKGQNASGGVTFLHYHRATAGDARNGDKRPVPVFNLDGVVVRFETTRRAVPWQIWQQALGSRMDESEFENGGWYLAGRPTWQTACDALVMLEKAGEIDQELARRHGNRTLDWIKGIRRWSRLSALERALFGGEASDDPELDLPMYHKSPGRARVRARACARGRRLAGSLSGESPRPAVRPHGRPLAYQSSLRLAARYGRLMGDL